jgi:hypothetical protein
MRWLGTFVLVTAVLTPAAAPWAADWGGLVPGRSVQKDVTAAYGSPTKTTSLKVDGYPTQQWVYEGAQAPSGLRRFSVDFGLLAPTGYRPDVVRALTLEPNPGVFTMLTIFHGWGEPDRMGKEGEVPVFLYYSGLLVYFDPKGQLAETLVFTMPQPPGAEDKPRPAPAPR